MNRALIVLKYEDNFFKDKRWERLIDYFNLYVRARVEYNNPKTLYRFTKEMLMNEYAKHKCYDAEEIRDLFQMVREKNYEVFKMFYENGGIKLK